jgi:probable rRNA maturation factor
MEINVLFDEGFENSVSENWLHDVAQQALLSEGQDAAEMGILITGQERLRALHKEYMGEDTPTDVLSFAMREKGPEGTPDFVFPEGELIHLGEVIISFPQAEIQAKEHKHPVKKEVTILLIHGTLHLLGYDHDSLEQRSEMQDRENAILKLVEGGPSCGSWE